MNGKTHTAVGIASTAIILGQTEFSVIDWSIALGVAVVGSTLPDIDVISGKKSWERVRYLILICAIYVVQTLFSSPKDVMVRRAIGLVGFAILYMFGSTQPHRGFTHSVAATIAFTVCVYFAFLGSPFAKWIMLGFATSYASHLLIDSLNKKGSQYLWPLPNRFALYLCTADGVVSKIIMIVSYVIAAWMIVSSVAVGLGASL